MAELLYSENGRVGIIVRIMAQQDVDTIARLPYTALISDSLYNDAANPHPRLNGAFPRFLRKYALKRRVLPYETAIHKMTLMPARRMGMADRGWIAAGAKADLLAFAPQCFTDQCDYMDGAATATGMRLVMVNGTIARENECLLKKVGRFLAAGVLFHYGLVQ